MQPASAPAPGSAEAAHGGVTLLADDLTGAADSVVAFADAGWDSYLVLSPAPVAVGGTGPGAVVARSLDTRAVDDETARTRTREAVTGQVPPDGRLYLKVDSTVRGTVAAQVAGALEGWRERHRGAFAVVCPAYPAMGRTVEDGMVLVRGEPVHLGPAGRDPVTPVTSSGVEDLLPGAVYAAPSPDPAELAHALRRLGRHHDVVCVGASTEQHLDALAAALTLLGPVAVPAGSAGLAQRVARHWRPESSEGAPDDQTGPRQDREPGRVEAPPLVVVSSLHDVALEQVRAAGQALGPAVAVRTPPAETLADHAATRDWAARVADEVGTRTALVVTAPSPRPDAPALTGREVAAALAAAAGTLMLHQDADRFGSLALVGGDGAAAVLAALGASAVRVTGSAAEGVPVGRITGGDRDGLTVVTKAGGFGDAETLTIILRTLEPHQKETP
ncbi:four-carbon acid sugar kinase family protein [Ornithinicoccus halotolerans]|uniref:four-carbon acid sugar kinase family protein n=1 Tax=Ornithinicoccus halotolerans TaxID=1748220 RepID=UPI001885F450|nr:four-carbon acid sugar kinase family protein [Ornithinicoccus halotolerans]